MGIVGIDTGRKPDQNARIGSECRLQFTFPSSRVLSKIEEEGILRKIKLPRELSANIDKAFRNCIEKLKGKANGYPRDEKIHKQNEENWASKMKELSGLVDNAIKAAGAENELEGRVNGNMHQGVIDINIEVNSKSTGFYARYAIRTMFDDVYLLINPGICGFERVDVKFEGANNGNARKAMLMFCDNLFNFKIPEV